MLCLQRSCLIISMFYLILMIIDAVSCQQFMGEQLINIFGSEKCIEGSLSNIYVKEENTLAIREAKVDYQNLLSNVSKFETQQEADKSVLSKLNEFAQYNELEYYFKLEKEEGPPHDRIFTVSLKIGEETYTANGKSLKKAKQQAAALLLEKTNYVPVPSKDELENVDNSLTPTVLLNNVCMKLGINVEYSLADKEYDMLKSNVIINDKAKRSYIQRLNDSLHSNKTIHVKKDLPNTKGPFTVKLQVGENVFYGSAHTIKAARHDAASNAIDFLLENKDNLSGECADEGSIEECQRKRNSIKSPISQAYEEAQIRGTSMECDVIKESGPSHKKTFVTQCQIGDLIATGEGRSKKESKKTAAVSILERIDELPPVSKEMQVRSVTKDKKKKKKKKNIIKSNFEEISLVAQQKIRSTFGFGNNKVMDSANLDDQDKKKTPKSKYKKQSFQDELLNIGNRLDFSINYSDFTEKDKHFSVLSLPFNPEYICLGQGLTVGDARNKAAKVALDLLLKLDFKNHFEGKHSMLENDIKSSVQHVLWGVMPEETK